MPKLKPPATPCKLRFDWEEDNQPYVWLRDRQGDTGVPWRDDSPRVRRGRKVIVYVSFAYPHPFYVWSGYRVFRVESLPTGATAAVLTSADADSIRTPLTGYARYDSDGSMRLEAVEWRDTCPS